MKTKIDIFSGFLGAGKTTLIKKLIAQAYSGEQLVLIENEFGEIGIDGGFLKDSGIEITEMNSGCICCSLVGDFAQALQKVLEQFHPDRIIIEPSGVGKLSDIIKAVQKINSNDLILNSATTVVDVNKCKMYMKNFGEFYNDQVSSASCIVLSHTGIAKEEKINEVIELLSSINPNTTIVSTNWDDVDGQQILDCMEHTNSLQASLDSLHNEGNVCPVCGHHHDDDDEDEHEHHCHCHDDDDEDEHEHHCHCHDEHHHHHADEVFTSWGKETAKSFNQEQIISILSSLKDETKYGIILRAKGIVKSDMPQWIHFDYVPGEPDVRKGSPDVIGRICVIGSHINEKELELLFGV